MIALVACGGDDNGGGGSGGSGNQNTGGSTSASGGSTTTGQGGSTTTGQGGSTTTGQGGSTTTGQGGAPAAGSTGTAGAGTTGPFTCAGTKASCSTISDFPTTAGQVWGKTDFGGGISVFGTGLTRDMTKTDALHITGPVKGYGYGFNLWFLTCSDLSAYTGVSFKIGGTAGTANMIDFQPQTNSDYPWQPSPMDKKGGCTATDATNPWGECVAPGKSGLALPASPTVVAVTWADVTGGKPTAWDATMSPKEIIGLQWQFPWSATATEYNVDVTIDDITLTGGTQTACPSGSSTGTGGNGSGGGSNGGAGGASASGGAGGSNGGASSGGAGGASNGGAAGSSSGGAGGASNGGAAGNAGAAGGSSTATQTQCETYCNGTNGVLAVCPTQAASAQLTTENCVNRCKTWPAAHPNFACYQEHLTNAINGSKDMHCPHATGAAPCSPLPTP